MLKGEIGEGWIQTLGDRLMRKVYSDRVRLRMNSTTSKVRCVHQNGGKVRTAYPTWLISTFAVASIPFVLPVARLQRSRVLM